MILPPPQQYTEKPQLYRAFRTLYLLSFCFGSRLVGPTYAPCNLGSIENIQHRILAIFKRLQRTNIECLDYSVLLERHDKADVFFYCDPPYFETENYYKSKTFDHEHLAELLKKSKSRWILSYNACPEICELYADYNQRVIQRRCGLNNKKAKDFAELLVWNFDEQVAQTSLLDFYSDSE